MSSCRAWRSFARVVANESVVFLLRVLALCGDSCTLGLWQISLRLLHAEVKVDLMCFVQRSVSYTKLWHHMHLARLLPEQRFEPDMQSCDTAAVANAGNRPDVCGAGRQVLSGAPWNALPCWRPRILLQPVEHDAASR